MWSGKNYLRRERSWKKGRGGWWEAEAQLTGIGAGALLSLCHGGGDKKHPKYCLPMRCFTCPKEQTPPTTPEDQLGVPDLQRSVKHCPDHLQPGFMVWSRTEQQLCWHREPGRAGGLSWTLLCHEVLPAGESHGPHSSLVAKAALSTTLESPSPHCSQSTASHSTVDPECKKGSSTGFFKNLFYFWRKKEKAIFSLAAIITNTQELRALICVCISTISSQQGFWTQERQIVLLPYKRGTGGKNAVQQL